MNLWVFLAFVLYVVAAILAGIERSLALCLIAAGLALTVLPTVLRAVG